MGRKNVRKIVAVPLGRRYKITKTKGEYPMKHKLGKILFISIMIVMVAVILIFLGSKIIENPFVKNNVLIKQTKKENKEPIKNSVETSTDTGKLPSAPQVGVLPYEENIVEIGKVFQYPGYNLDIVIDEVNVTKENVDSDAPYHAMDDENYPMKFDENYNLVNDFSYVTVRLTLKNLEPSPQKVRLNTFRYFIMEHESGKYVSPFYMGDMRGYKTQADPYVPDKSYALVEIPAESDFSCNLVYIEPDEDINGKDAYIQVDFTGNVDPENQLRRYVRLW